LLEHLFQRPFAHSVHRPLSNVACSVGHGRTVSKLRTTTGRRAFAISVRKLTNRWESATY
jgi:hypothetical protein